MAKRKKKDKELRYYAWLVAYINSDHLHLVQSQLAKFQEYEEVQPFIPTVRVLKKKFKGKNHFEEVPLLFQYGFFKVPRKFAIHWRFLEGMQENISCIFGWVKDPVKIIKGGMGDTSIPVATATPREIAKLVKASMDIGAHGAEDLHMIKPGDFIILKGYPYEGVEAEFVEVNPKKKTVKVRIIMFSQKKDVDVSYDNVFFNLYQNKGYDDSVSTEKSLDEMKDNKTLDKLMGKLSKRNNNGAE